MCSMGFAGGWGGVGWGGEWESDSCSQTHKCQVVSPQGVSVSFFYFFLFW